MKNKTTGKETPRTKYLILLSLPSVLCFLLEPLASLIDTLYMGRLGTQYVATLAVGATVFDSFNWIFNFLFHVSIQGISLRLGRGQSDRAINLVKISLLLALLLGLLCILILTLAAGPLLSLAGSTEVIEDPLQTYFLIRLWEMPWALTGLVIMGTLRAYDRVGRVLAVSAISVASNAIISGILIFYFEWGIAGAAIGTVCAWAILLLVGLWELSCIPNFWSQFKREKIANGEWSILGDNSLYFLGRSTALTLVFFSSTKIASQFTTHILAAHHILIKLWLLSSFFIDGLAVIANSLAARYFGNNQQSLFRQMSWRMSLMALVIGILFLVTYAGLGSWLWPLFSDDPKLWLTIGLFWPLVWASQPLNALAFIADGILFGAEAFRYLCKHMWIGVIFGYIPLAALSLREQNYSYLLAGIALLSLYRMISGYRKIHSLCNP